MIYSVILPVAQATLYKVMVWLINKKLERMWKEAVRV